jgi:hypothetical protein
VNSLKEKGVLFSDAIRSGTERIGANEMSVTNLHTRKDWGAWSLANRRESLKRELWFHTLVSGTETGPLVAMHRAFDRQSGLGNHRERAKAWRKLRRFWRELPF